MCAAKENIIIYLQPQGIQFDCDLSLSGKLNNKAKMKIIDQKHNLPSSHEHLLILHQLQWCEVLWWPDKSWDEFNAISKWKQQQLRVMQLS